MFNILKMTWAFKYKIKKKLSWKTYLLVKFFEMVILEAVLKKYYISLNIARPNLKQKIMMSALMRRSFRNHFFFKLPLSDLLQQFYFDL